MKKTGMLYKGKKNKSYISYAAVPIIFVLVQMFYHIGLLNSYWYQIIQLACINGIVAMSLNLVNGITGQFSLGQAGFMSVGAYTSAMLTKLVFAPAMENPAASYLLFFVALVIGASAAALIGFLIGIPSFYGRMASCNLCFDSDRYHADSSEGDFRKA